MAKGAEVIRGVIMANVPRDDVVYVMAEVTAELTSMVVTFTYLVFIARPILITCVSVVSHALCYNNCPELSSRY